MAREIAHKSGWLYATVETADGFEVVRIYKCRYIKTTQSWMRPLNAVLAGKCSHSDGAVWVRDEDMMGGGGYSETVVIWETCPGTVSHNNCIADRTPLIGFERVPECQPV